MSECLPVAIGQARGEWTYQKCTVLGPTGLFQAKGLLEAFGAGAAGSGVDDSHLLAAGLRKREWRKGWREDLRGRRPMRKGMF